MKYLKTFNERLKTDTYLSAAEKLKKNHPERAERLETHALNVNYDKYGTFNLIKGEDGYNMGLSQSSNNEINIGKYKLSWFGFDYGMASDLISDGNPLENLNLMAIFEETEETAKFFTRTNSRTGVKSTYNNHERKLLNIIIPYTDGKFEKAVIEFWENEDKFLFADRESVVKFKKAISDIIDNTRVKYNEVEAFPFRETLLRQLDDLSKEDPDFKFDENDFHDLIENIKLKHISTNDLFSTRKDRFKLPDLIK